MAETFVAKGHMLLRYTEEGIQKQIWDEEFYNANGYDDDLFKHITQSQLTFEDIDLMDGKDFFNAVDQGCIMDDDGSLGEVFIDGFISNLGLCHEGLCQGRFLVDGPTWLALCKENDIKVNWCNK